MKAETTVNGPQVSPKMASTGTRQAARPRKRAEGEIAPWKSASGGYNDGVGGSKWEMSVKPSLLFYFSKKGFISNQVRLALFVLAYNLGNFMRRFALPSEVSHWSLSSIQLKLIKIGAKIVSHSRMTVFQMAEVTVSEKLFRSMLSRIHRLGRACARAPALSQ